MVLQLPLQLLVYFGIIKEVNTRLILLILRATLTLQLTANSAEEAADIFTGAARTRWEADALDLLPDGRTICLRLAGPAAALTAIAREVLARWPGRTLTEAEAAAVWLDLREFRWSHPGGTLVKAALTPTAWPGLAGRLRSLDNARAHVSIGGNVAFISVPSPAPPRRLEETLRELGVAAFALRGDGPLWLGAHRRFDIAPAVKKALDAEGRFPGLDE